MIPVPLSRIPIPVKVYTLLTTTNIFALPSFVKLCKTLSATGVTVFASPQSFAPDQATTTKIQSQISALSQKENDAATKRDYVLASSIREEITDLELKLKEMHDQAAAYYVDSTAPIKSFLSTVILDPESWTPDSPITEQTFLQEAANISNLLVTKGIRNRKQTTPLHQRIFVPLSTLNFDHSQPVVQMATISSDEASVVGDLVSGEDLPSGPQPANITQNFGPDTDTKEETETLDDQGIPQNLSPNQRAFVKAIVSKEASNFAQASNVAGLSPSSTKKVITDITKKWPEFPEFVKQFLKIDDNE